MKLLQAIETGITSKRLACNIFTLILIRLKAPLSYRDLEVVLYTKLVILSLLLVMMRVRTAHASSSTILIERSYKIKDFKGIDSKPTYIPPVIHGTVTSPFGVRWGTMHYGIDIGANEGDKVIASAGGKVVRAGYNGGCGHEILIEHYNHYKTRYCHNSKLLATVGEIVDQGDTIALIGSTGHSTGPHSHIEIINSNGDHVNPAVFLTSLKPGYSF
jgi:murein DD-endopeptidase MepM/ murein hydrolase activator NlpD